MSYKILLFDLDDTLLDFGANETDSLNKLFHKHGYTFSDELFRVYNSVNKQLWADYENGNIVLDDVLNSRFSETMLRLGKAVNGIEWENQYRELLGNGCQLMEGALEVCQSLSVSHRLFVITNGITHTQIKRLKQSGLYEYFEDIFDSQSIGFQKPSKEFFDYVMSHIKDFNIKESLIIGDSLNTDIKGGLLSGIDTCWISRESQKCSAEIQSTYTVTSLAELYDICTPKNDPWREKVVSCALAYANHIWKPTYKNIFHGYDTDEIFINTPDSNYISAKYNCGWWTVDQFNKGMPYNWGGSSTIEEFDTGITAGKFAGNVPDSRDNGASKYCVGVDCSGLVTICWGVAKRLSTKSIVEIASSLDSMNSLLPGDIILLPGSHVMIFINFVDDEKAYAQIVDASRSTGRVLLRTVILSDLFKKGYKGYRKNTEF